MNSTFKAEFKRSEQHAGETDEMKSKSPRRQVTSMKASAASELQNSRKTKDEGERKVARPARQGKGATGESMLTSRV